MQVSLLHLHHLHLSLNHGGRWGTTDDFTASFLHFSLFSTTLWDSANSRSVHSLMLSSHLLKKKRWYLCFDQKRWQSSLQSSCKRLYRCSYSSCEFPLIIMIFFLSSLCPHSKLYIAWCHKFCYLSVLITSNMLPCFILVMINGTLSQNQGITLQKHKTPEDFYAPTDYSFLPDIWALIFSAIASPLSAAPWMQGETSQSPHTPTCCTASNRHSSLELYTFSGRAAPHSWTRVKQTSGSFFSPGWSKRFHVGAATAL